jgi:hypothetical protein
MKRYGDFLSFSRRGAAVNLLAFALNITMIAEPAFDLSQIASFF